jgi:molybdopterin-containing oxidoreductase family membrane subunit
MIIPFILLLLSRGRNMAMMATASAMMLVGIFIMRYDLVVLGQVVSVFHDLGVNEYKDLLAYTPSVHEIGIVVGSLGLAAMTFLLGEKIFKGHETDSH